MSRKRGDVKKIDAGTMADPTIYALWYGQAKMLKTSLALLIPPSMRPVDYLDADRGAQIRLRLMAMTAEEREAAGVPWLPLYDLGGPWIKDGIRFYEPEEKSYYKDLWDFATGIAPKSDAKTVVIDTISRIGDGIMQEVTHTSLTSVKGDQKETRAKLSTNGVETIVPSQQDFGLSQNRLMEFLGLLQANCAHKNVIIISHEKTGEIKDASGAGRIIAGPRSIGNALLEVIPSMTDIALRFEPKVSAQMVEEGGKKMMKQVQGVSIRTRNHNIYIAGDRSGMFTDGEILDPGTFWKKFEGIITLAQAK